MSENTTDTPDVSTESKGQDAPEKFDASYVKSLRDEAARYRTERNDFKTKVETLNEQVARLSKIESLITGGKGDDPETVINSLKSENNRLKLERTFGRVAKQHDADEDLAFAYLDHKGLLKGIDISDEKALSELVKKTVEENPKFRNTQPRKTGDNGAEKSDTGGFDMNAFIRKSVRQ